ncbi:MAG: hybrid sensor histidine kinase/response regulator, partial [bacterium]|nr:hybrid sensor histidine kinase/response regulator [bacterium]
MSRKGRIARVTVMILVGGLLGYHFGARAMLVWLTVNGALEGLLLYLDRRFRPRTTGRSSLLVRLGPAAAFCTVWSIMAALSWSYGPPAMKFAALIILFGMVVEGLKYGALSRSALLVMTPPPFIALIAAPLIAGGFKPWELVVVVITLAGLLGYMLDTAR